MRLLGKLEVLIKANTNKFNKDIDKSEKKVKGFAASGKKHLAGLSKSFVSLAGVAGVGLVAKSFLDTGIAAEKMSRGLEAALGSVQKGAEAQKFLREESERLGLVFENQVSDFQKIAAAARGTALEGQAVRDVYISIVEASTALQMSADDTSGTLRALSQMISKGNVQAEELRGQLGERLPGAFQLAAKAMGVTTQELNKMLEMGQVAATDMLPKLAKVLREQFAGSIASASKTAQAEINRLSNAYFEMKKTFAETGALSVFATVVRWTTEDVKFLGDQIKLISGYWIDFFTTTKTEEIKAQIKEIEAELKSFKGFGIGLEKHTERFAASKIKEIQDLKKELIELQKIAEKPAKIDGPFSGKKVKIDNSWIKNMQAQEKFALEMSEAEQSRLNARYELEQEINEKFHNELLSDTDFRLQELDSQFLAYDTFVKDKAALDEWYVKKHEEIMADVENTNISMSDAARSGFEEYAEEAGNMSDAIAQSTLVGLTAMEDGLIEFCRTGKLNFRDFANSVISDLMRIYAKQVITGLVGKIAGAFAPVSSVSSAGLSLGGGAGVNYAVNMPFAKGGVFDSSSLSKYSGSVVNQPTTFAFAHGAGIMGEAGPEAILPLSRNSSGKLGVEASGQNNNTPTTINVTYNINAVDAYSFMELTRRNPDAISGPLINEIKNGNGALRQAINVA